MIKNYLQKPYVDHYLQTEIISTLAAAEKPLRFSQLKQDGIDNSLFMYHMNKLIDRGLITKQANGLLFVVLHLVACP